MSGIISKHRRYLITGISIVLVMWFITIQWLHGYTLHVLSAESDLRIDCEKLTLEGADLREVQQVLTNAGYEVTIRDSKLSAGKLVPFNGPLYDTSVKVGVIMRFEDGKAARFRIYKSVGAL